MKDSVPHIKLKSAPGCIYLFPVPLSSGSPSGVLPATNIELIKRINYFVVENLRSARRFLKSCDRDIDIDTLEFAELSEHTPSDEVAALLTPVLDGKNCGILSEAGCPAVADPGALLVAEAQRKGVKVVPLVGPSSILLSLMASGFNGQSFAFSGYLPVEKTARTRAIKELERKALTTGQTQIFIETPYRNNRLLAELVSTLSPSTLLCVAADVTGERESVLTHQVSVWAKASCNYDKIPAIFLIGRSER